MATVIKLELIGPPLLDQSLPGPNAAGVVELPASLAAIVNAYGANARLIGSGVDAYIGDWDRANISLNWEFTLGAPTTLVVEAEVASLGGGSLVVTCGKQHAEVALPAGGNADEYHRVRLARFSFETPGEQSIELKSVGENWGKGRLRAVRLRVEPVALSSPPHE